MPRSRKYKPNQVIPPFAFRVPKGHRIINIKITQESGPVDKQQALKILKTRTYAVAIVDMLKYRGATSKFHVFSYDPTAV